MLLDGDTSWRTLKHEIGVWRSVKHIDSKWCKSSLYEVIVFSGWLKCLFAIVWQPLMKSTVFSPILSFKCACNAVRLLPFIVQQLTAIIYMLCFCTKAYNFDTPEDCKIHVRFCVRVDMSLRLCYFTVTQCTCLLYFPVVELYKNYNALPPLKLHEQQIFMLLHKFCHHSAI